MRIHDGTVLAHSVAADPRQAVQELHTALAQPEIALVLFFCSSNYDLVLLAEAINRTFAGIQVVGCTTAGEIGPAGYRNHSISGASFAASSFVAVNGILSNLQQYEMKAARPLAAKLRYEFELKSGDVKYQNRFGLLLIDGLSVREEAVTRSLQNAFGPIPLVGGSAADDMKFERTLVFADGRFHDDSAVLLLIGTALPFRTFKTQHFIPTDRRVVVTAADVPRRIVTEIDGWPASEAYARLAEMDERDVGPRSFTRAPVVVLIDGTDYVRSIQKINPDRSLSFYCAIEEGVVLRLARGVDLTENLEHAFANIRSEIGPPQLTICFDCVLRRLEIVQDKIEHPIELLLRSNNSIGLSTYGEQFAGLHVNQTLTGIAIGAAPIGARDG